MPRALVYSDKALADLDAARGWLSQPGAGQTAQRRLAAIWTAIERLRTYPCRHPFGRHRGVRELGCGGGYRVLYRVKPDTGRHDTSGDVLVLRVFGPGQDRTRL